VTVRPKSRTKNRKFG